MTRQHAGQTYDPSEFQLAGTGADITDPAALAKQPAVDWVPAVVPGGVHEARLAAGRRTCGGRTISVRRIVMT